VFVLNIAGSLPTLRPLYSQIYGHLPSILTSAISRKNHTRPESQNQGCNQKSLYTIGSEPSRWGEHRGAGNITIDLGEIDNMNLNTKHYARSSAESNLLTNSQQVGHYKGANRSKAPSLKSAEVEGNFEIRVRQDFTTGYDGRSNLDQQAFERSRRP
jgi:hypothetical protein